MGNKVVLKLHQMLGSILSLAFVVWFISGFVMLFYSFPHAPKEKLFHNQQVLTGSDSILDISAVLYGQIDKLTLEKINNIPVYRLQDPDGNSQLINAQTLSRIDSVYPEEIEALLKKNYNDPIYKKEIIHDFDSWIPWSHYSKYFPIQKSYLKDSANTVAYASIKTGEIVQETTRNQRWLARFGAIPHWFYFKSLRLKKDLWIKVVVWISGIGSIMCLFGIVLGFYRYRKRKALKKQGLFQFSPYKKPWYKWHHVSGFFFGLIAFTFVFSGMMSLQDVPKFIVPVKNENYYIENWNKKCHLISDFKLSVKAILESNKITAIKRIEWDLTAIKAPFYRVYTSDLNKPVLVNASNTDFITLNVFSQEDIHSEIASRIGRNDFNIQTLNSYDNYYGGKKEPPLPVIKAAFEDQDKTWLYINPSSLQIARVLNKNTRFRRWLYKGLHSFDFKFFAQCNWLRISILFILSVFGTVISVTGLVLSYNYVKRKIKKHIKA